VNVFAINGSARLERGHTAVILNAFLEGVKKAGAKTELYYSQKLNIKPCTGCFYCWNKETLGKCVIRNDDMDMLYPKLRKADILVLAAPVYIPLPDYFQSFMNRLLPLMNPVLKTTPNGRTRAITNKDVRIKKIVLVSTCGWWEMGNFNVVLHIAKELAANMSVEFAGAVLRPHADYMVPEDKETKKVLENCELAGFQLIKEGKMHPDILKQISKPLIKRKNYIEENI
jgi:multimeric flavodoxin WrbA